MLRTIYLLCLLHLVHGEDRPRFNLKLAQLGILEDIALVYDKVGKSSPSTDVYTSSLTASTSETAFIRFEDENNNEETVVDSISTSATSETSFIRVENDDNNDETLLDTPSPFFNGFLNPETTTLSTSSLTSSPITSIIETTPITTSTPTTTSFSSSVTFNESSPPSGESNPVADDVPGDAFGPESNSGDIESVTTNEPSVSTAFTLDEPISSDALVEDPATTSTADALVEDPATTSTADALVEDPATTSTAEVLAEDPTSTFTAEDSIDPEFLIPSDFSSSASPSEDSNTPDVSITPSLSDSADESQSTETPIAEFPGAIINTPESLELPNTETSTETEVTPEEPVSESFGPILPVPTTTSVSSTGNTIPTVIPNTTQELPDAKKSTDEPINPTTTETEDAPLEIPTTVKSENPIPLTTDEPVPEQPIATSYEETPEEPPIVATSTGETPEEAPIIATSTAELPAETTLNTVTPTPTTTVTPVEGITDTTPSRSAAVEPAPTPLTTEFETPNLLDPVTNDNPVIEPSTISEVVPPASVVEPSIQTDITKSTPTETPTPLETSTQQVVAPTEESTSVQTDTTRTVEPSQETSQVTQSNLVSQSDTLTKVSEPNSALDSITETTTDNVSTPTEVPESVVTASIETQAPPIVIPVSSDTPQNSPATSTTKDWLPSQIIQQTSEVSAITQATEAPTQTSGLPRAITPATTRTPEDDHELITIGFKSELNYRFVVDHALSSAQIFQYLTPALLYPFGNAEEYENVFVKRLVPYTADGIDYAITVAEVYFPRDSINAIAQFIITPESLLYRNPDPTQKTLANLIDSRIPLKGLDTGANSGSRYGASNTIQNGSLDSSSGSAVNNGGQIAGIAVGSAAACGIYMSLMLLLFKRYKQKKNGLMLPDSESDIGSEADNDRSSSFSALFNRSSGSGSGSGTASGERPKISTPVNASNSLGWTN